MQKIKYLSLCVLLTASPQLMASAIYLGYSQSQQASSLGNHNLDYKPAGPEVLVSLDLNDNWVLSADYSTQDDELNLAQDLNAAIDSDSWGLGLSYYWQDWSFSASYSKLQDEQKLERQAPRPFLFAQEADAPSYSISAAYFWGQEHWFYNASLSLSYNDWQQTTTTPGNDRQRPQRITENGDSTFASVFINANRRFELAQQTAINLGLGLGWNQLLNDSSDVLSINGRNINQTRPPSNRNRLTSVAAIGGDSYGQASLFISYDFNPDWFAEISTSVNFGDGDSNQLWAVNLGYLF